jgi:hypothetical protein
MAQCIRTDSGDRSNLLVATECKRERRTIRFAE